MIHGDASVDQALLIENIQKWKRDADELGNWTGFFEGRVREREGWGANGAGTTICHDSIKIVDRTRDSPLREIKILSVVLTKPADGKLKQDVHHPTMVTTILHSHLHSVYAHGHLHLLSL